MSSPVDVGTLVATITADDTELVRIFQQAQGVLDQFGGTVVQAQLSADQSQLQSGVSEALSTLNGVNGTTATAQIQGDATNALGATDQVASAVQQLNGSSATVQIEGDATQAVAAAADAESAAHGVASQGFSVPISGDIGGLQSAIAKAKDALDKGLGAAAGIALGAALGGSLASAINMEPARKRIVAQLRLTPEEARTVNDASSNLFKNNWAEDIGGANEVIANTVSAFKDLRSASTEELAAVGTKAAAVADLMQVDIGKATRTAGQLVRNGLAKDATEAFDLLAAASQATTTEMQDDLLEVASEYSQQFQQLGLSGSQSLALIAGASQDGAIQMDKIGDALKEFTILGTDLSTNSVAAFKTLGLDAKAMADQLLAGGDTAEAAFQKIVSGLQDIPDKATQANTAIALFGTPIEDLGTANIPRFLDQLGAMDQGLGDVAGRADEVAAQIGTNVAGGFTSFWNSVQLSAEALGTNLLPVFTPIIAGLGYMLDGINFVVGAFGGLASPVGIAAVGLTALVVLFPKIIAGLKALPGLAGKAGTSLSAAFGPLGLALAGITAGIALFAGGNADAEARVAAHADAVAELKGKIDGTSGAFKDGSAAVAAYTEKFAPMLDQLSQVGVGVTTAAQLIVNGASDGGKSWQLLRDTIARGLPVDKIIADNDYIASSVEAMSRITGQSQQDILRTIAAGGEAQAALVNDLVAKGGRSAEEYQSQINDTRLEVERFAPSVATARLEVDAAAEAQRQATAVAKEQAIAADAAAQAEANRGMVVDESMRAQAGTVARYVEDQLRARQAAEDYGKSIQAASELVDGSVESEQRRTVALAAAATQQAQANQEYEDAQAAVEAAGEALSTFEQASKDSADAQQDLADQAQRVSDELDRQSGRAISLEEANARAAETGDQLADTFKQGAEGALRLNDAIIQSDGSINTSTETARTFREGVLGTRDAMVDQATAAFDAAGGLGNLEGATKAAEAATQATYDQFIQTATAAGLTGKAAQDLAKEYGLLPADVTTAVIADDRATAKLTQVKTQAETLAARKYVATIDADTSGLLAKIADANARLAAAGQTSTNRFGAAPRKAMGGEISGPGTGTSDEVPFMGSNGEHVFRAEEVNKLGGHGEVYRMRAAIRSGNLPKYARGGALGGDILSGLAGNVATTNRGASEGAVIAALNALADAVTTLRETEVAATKDARDARSDYLSAVDAFRKVRAAGEGNVADARSDRDKNVRDAKGDVSKARADETERNAAALAKVTAAQRLSTKTHEDRVKRDKAIADAEAAQAKVRKDNAAAVSKAEDKLARARSQGNEAVRRATTEANRNNAASKAKADAEKREYQAAERARKAADARADEAAADLRRTQKARGLLVALGRNADQAAKNLGDARDKLDRIKADKAALAASVAGGFDQGGLASLGGKNLSGADIAQAFKFRLGKGREYKADLDALKGKLSPELYRQLATMGVENGGQLADALSKADPATLRSINRSNSLLTSVGNAAGAGVAQELYGKEQAAATNELRAHTKTLRDIKTIMGGLSRGIGIEFASRLSGRSRDDFLKWLAAGQAEADRR